MYLLTTRRFLPLFLTQFLGAFNDNLFKNALVMLITYRLAVASGDNAQLLVTLAAGLFILPFFLFSATAGQLADKYDRAFLSRLIKLAEIGLMVAAACGLMLGNIWFLMLTLFLLGMQATFFGPIKYALLPQHLAADELLAGNAYVEAGTFLAILAGTILGGLLILGNGGPLIVTLTLLAVAGAGYTASRFIPPAAAPDPTLRIQWNIITETLRILRFSRENKRVFRCILGISWFWLVGAVFFSQFPSYAKDIWHANASVVTLFLTMFSIGIGIGSVWCNRLLKGRVHSNYVPLAALGISFFTFDLCRLSIPLPGPELLDAWTFLSQPHAFHALLDLLSVAICGGLYIVPLYAIMQRESSEAHRARIIAANNVVNALFMVAAALATLLMLALSFSIPAVFATTAILNGLVAMYICRLLPDALLRSFIRIGLRCLYRLEIRGMEHYHAAGPHTLIIANHVSFLDPLLIAAALPEPVTFAVNTHIAKRWWIKPLLSLVNVFPLDPTNPLAAKSLIEALRENRKCMIFPEGRITTTGSLMKIYEGPAVIADKAGAQLLPIRIDGAERTPFSRLRGTQRLCWFPKITLTILPSCQLNIPEEIKGKHRRQRSALQLYDIMSRMMFESAHYRQPLFTSLLNARDIHGGKHIIVEDMARAPLTYRTFIAKTFVMGRMFHRAIGIESNVGLLLPNVTGNALSFFGLHAFGHVPAMLNFSAGPAQIVNACQAACVTSVITAHKFITMASLEPVVQALTEANIRVIYLEDFRAQLTLADKLYGLLATLAPRIPYACLPKPPADAPAVILFTSGSEGTPKGVVLSHANVQANRLQLAACVDFGPTDIVFNCLPMFHSFGLTAGTLLPLLSGIRTFFYPSPLHYRIIPEIIYDTNATMLFGTDTFLSGYARFAQPYDFHTIRYVFAGAEKLREETRKNYMERFGIRIFEGYGVTETAPVIAVNTPMYCKPGTVGRFIPSVEYHLEPVPGIEEGGQLWVRGPNIMLGYFKSDNPGVLQPPAEGWHDTGDVVAVDDTGYITIKGRVKRFAKIGGEMVSLAAVEAIAVKCWPEHMHAAISIPDAKKGEQIVLLTTHEEITRETLMPHFRTHGLTELALPRTVMWVKEVPMLGTGKIDYVRAKEMGMQSGS